MVGKIVTAPDKTSLRKGARAAKQNPTLAQLWAALFLIAEWEEISVEDLYLLVIGLGRGETPQKALTAFVRSYGRRLHRTEKSKARSTTH